MSISTLYIIVVLGVIAFLALAALRGSGAPVKNKKAIFESGAGGSASNFDEQPRLSPIRRVWGYICFYYSYYSFWQKFLIVSVGYVLVFWIGIAHLFPEVWKTYRMLDAFWYLQIVTFMALLLWSIKGVAPKLFAFVLTVLVVGWLFARTPDCKTFETEAYFPSYGSTFKTKLKSSCYISIHVQEPENGTPLKDVFIEVEAHGRPPYEQSGIEYPHILPWATWQGHAPSLDGPNSSLKITSKTKGVPIKVNIEVRPTDPAKKKKS